MGHDATVHAMAQFTLRKAAELVGVSKSTIFRAIKSGRLSAMKSDTGDFAIDAAELFRVYKPLKGAAAVVGQAGQVKRPTQRVMGHDATVHGTPNGTPETPVETTVRLAELETELRVLRELLDEMKRQRDDYRTERDDWKNRAERLLTFQEATKTANAPQGVADILQRMKERQAAKAG
jgi:excisionase family DNA binding protein